MRTTARLNAACALLFVTAALFGCSYVAVRSAPAKEASDATDGGCSEG